MIESVDTSTQSTVVFGGTPPDELGAPEEPDELEEPEEPDGEPDELLDPEELDPDGVDPDDEDDELEPDDPEPLPPASGAALGELAPQPEAPIAARPSAPPSKRPPFVHRGQAEKCRDVFIGCR